MKTLRSHQSTFRLLLIATVALGAVGGYSSPVSSSEDAVKAAFVYNFVKLTKWPSSAPGGNLVVGVVGSSGAGSAVKSVVDGKDSGGRKIEVKSVDAGGAKSCHVVFVCGSGGPPATGGSPVLLIGESGGFASKGGMIGFVSVDGKVKFEVNMGAAKKAGLAIDAKLASLGKVVG
jgi:hypothetical protein